MSRYDDFVAALGRMGHRLRTWEQSHRRFGEQLISGLGEYGQVPANRFDFAPDAMDFDDDGWLHAAVKLRGESEHGSSTVLLRIRREGDGWAIGHGDRWFRLAEGDETARRAFYESVFYEVIAMLDSIEEPTEARRPRIGFAPVEAGTKQLRSDDLMS
jgi:hypothetical protein